MTNSRSSFVEICGARVHTEAWGEGSRTVLLVHGLGESTLVWHAVAGPLARRSESTVIAVDLPGFGRSLLGHRRAHVDDSIEIVAALLDELEPELLVGHSMGGLAALGALDARPGGVEGLVLMAPALQMASMSAWRVLRFVPVLVPGLGPRLVSRVRRWQGAERAVDQHLEGVMHDPTRLDPELRERMVELREDLNEDRRSAMAYAGAARSITVRMGRGFTWAQGIDVPTLVIQGRDDQLVPVDLVDRLRTRRPDWRYEVIEQCGHTPQLEYPERVIDLVATWATEVASAA